MDDLQLNITVAKKSTKKGGASQKNESEFKFMSKPAFTGRTIARKRPMPAKKTEGERPIKVPKQSEPQSNQLDDLSTSLRDLSENKGKFHGKNYQDLSDDIQLKQKPRAGGWISSLFKNNPGVPRIGQRAVKPLVEKVFAEKSFSDLDIHPHSAANLQQNLGLKDLMVVQQSAIPVILLGRDALIRSQTGSGKTLAYALPIVEGLQAIRPKINRLDGIRVVVVVPTRELAVQTHELFVKLVKPFTWIVPGLLSGGQKRKAEKARIRKGLSILVGTPGRINDHLRHTQSLNFSKTGCLVLDEADRLLDMGYEKDVAAIVKAIEDHKKNATYDPLAMVRNQVKTTFPEEELAKKESNDSPEDSEIKHYLTEVFLSKERQTTLLSATLTKAVENLAGITLVDPVFVDASEGKALVADSLKQSKNRTNPGPSDTEILNTAQTENKETVKAEIKEPYDDKQEYIQNHKSGLKSFKQDNPNNLFNEDDCDTNIKASKPVPFPIKTVEKPDKADSSQTKTVQSNTTLGVVDMESDDEYVMPTETDVTPTYQTAVQTAIKADEMVMPVSVRQTFLVVPMKLRLVTLCSLIVEHCLMNKKGGKLMVFMATLEMVDYHAELIEIVLTGKKGKAKQKDGQKKKDTNKKEDGEDASNDSDSEFEVDYQAPPEGGVMPSDIDVFKLHGSMPHTQRIEVFDQFRKANKGVLFCTDVAARGLDVPRVDMVVQYCAPASVTDYVHRVGRTGRAANVGEAVLFLLPSETPFMRHLEQKRIRLVQRDEKRSLEPLLSIVPGAASANRAAVAVQARLEHTAHAGRDWLLRASRAYMTWVRFYSGYPRDVREFLDAKQLHLGHAAKAFALRDPPATLARRARGDPDLLKEKPTNNLTVHEEQEKKRPGFPKAKLGGSGARMNRQSSMHTASEFDSGLSPLEQVRRKIRRNK